MENQRFDISRLTPLFQYLKKQAENERSNRTIEIAVTFGLISFFLFSAVKPTVFTISALIGEVKAKKALSVQLKNKIDQVIVAQDEFSRIQEKYSLVEDALPSSPNYVDAVSQIADISQKNNILLDKISFNPSEKNFFTTQISTRSSFTDSLNLVSQFFQYRRLFDISTLRIGRAGSPTQDKQITISFPLDIYYWNDKNDKK